MKSLLIFLTVSIAMALTDEQALQEFAKGNLKFTAQIYKELIKNVKGNLIVSPLSAEVVLALTEAGAKGETAQELITGLSLPSTREKTEAALKSLLPSLKKSDDNLKLLSANKLFVANGFEIKESFKEVATKVYEAGSENVNFGENVKAAGIINQWVEGQTNNKIKDLIKPGDVDSDTKLVLVNALYFSGKWINPFEVYLTRKEKFYKNKKDFSEVDMMHTEESFQYYESAQHNAKFLVMPYIGGNISMTIVLPNEKEGLARIEENLESLLAPQPWTWERVAVSLPKFTIETEIKFVPILKSLGIEKLFDRAQANLTGLSDQKGLYVNDVIQKAFINVTESGTEAAAATAVGWVLASAPPPANRFFKSDHPFIYYIQSNGSLLFVGKVSRFN